MNEPVIKTYMVSYITHSGTRKGSIQVQAPNRALAIGEAILAKHKRVGNNEECGGICWDTFVVEKEITE